jgi:type I restriction enzyme S subunit
MIKFDKSVIPNEWEVATVGDCCDILDSQRIPLNRKERRERQGDIPYYGANGQVGWVDEWIFDEELVLLAEDGGHFDEYQTRSIAYRVKGKTWVNNHAHVLRARSCTSNVWIYYNLVHRDLRKHIKGGTRDKLNQGDLRDVRIPMPPEQEQRRIADVLDTVDAAIQETDAVVEKQEQVKTGLLQDLLTRGLDAEGRLRDPEREPEAFRETDLGFRPVEWDVESAGEILNGITQGWSPKCRPDPASQGQWGVLRTTSVQWSGFTEVENKALPSDLSPRPEYEVEALDVLMTRAGPASRVGVVALVEDVRGKLLLSDKLYRLEHRDDILPRFLHAALSSEKIQNLLGREKTGMAGSQTNISQRIVKDLPFPHPPIEEQKRIVSVLKEHSGHIEGEKAYRSKLQSLKNGLMQDLLTGRIRVPEAQERVDEVIA